MKNIIVLLLSVVMVFGMCACTGGAPDSDGALEGLCVGFGRENVTPDFAVGLGGYSDAATRKSQGLVDYVYVTCIAMTENDETILLYTIDSSAAGAEIVADFRQAVSPATGIPEDHIFISATHAHSAPALTGTGEDTLQYKDLFYDAVVRAAQTALEDRATTNLYSTSTQLEGMNFVRHYLLSNGTYAGSNFGDFNSAPAIEHATKGDNQMVLVKFDRVDEAKQDILLVNWQSHPDAAKDIGYNYIAAGFVGPLRTKLEKQTGMQVAYFTGASGNQNPTSKIPGESHNLTWKEYGEKLAEFAADALPSLTPVEGTAVQCATVKVDVSINHEWDAYLDQANEVYDLWKSVGKEAGDALAETYGFTSVYQARSIRTNANLPATQPVELNVFRVGGIGFVNGHYEMFSTAGLYIKENSLFDTTVICNGNSGYIPCKEAYDYRSYESDTSKYAQGTSEMLAEKFVESLNSLH